MIKGERRESEGARKVEQRKGARWKVQKWYIRGEKARKMEPKRWRGKGSVNERTLELNAEHLGTLGYARVHDHV